MSRREPSGAPPLAVDLAIVLGVALTAVSVYWAAPRIVALMHPGTGSAVHARALGECRAPAEHEELRIIVHKRSGRLVTECAYAARATDGRRP